MASITPALVEQTDLVFSSTNFDDFESLVDTAFPAITQESLVKGKIININKDFVTIDIGYKSYGQVAYAEFLSLDGKFGFALNDQVELYLEYLENMDGTVVLSREKANRLRIWEDVKNICEKNETIEGIINAKIKGGLAVDIGIKAFLPGSQIDLKPVKDIDSMLGQKYEFRILKYDQKRGNVVLSRRALLEIDWESKKKDFLETLEVGAKVKGVVKNITDYGLFVNLGGIDGLLHITDMTWGRISHPSELYNVGDEIDVIILSYDETSQKVSLGLKQREQDPWISMQENLKVGMKVNGKVVNLTNYGAFIEISEGVEGLLHVSEMSWTKKNKAPGSLLKLGDEVQAMIKEIEIERKRISLSIRDLEENPWKNTAERYPVGTVVEGTVRNITDFGIFIELEDGIDGLVHSSDIFWSQRNKNKINELFTKDQKIPVKILNIDVEKGRLSLGIKQITDDPWKGVDLELHTGDEMEGKIVHVADFGVFVELKEGLEGLIHFSEVGKDLSKKQLIDKFPLNTNIKIRVIKVDANEKRLALAPIFDLQGEPEGANSEQGDSTAEQPAKAEKATADLKADKAVEDVVEPVVEAAEDKPKAKTAKAKATKAKAKDATDEPSEDSKADDEPEAT